MDRMLFHLQAAFTNMQPVPICTAGQRYDMGWRFLYMETMPVLKHLAFPSESQHSKCQTTTHSVTKGMKLWLAALFVGVHCCAQHSTLWDPPLVQPDLKLYVLPLNGLTSLLTIVPIIGHEVSQCCGCPLCCSSWVDTLHRDNLMHLSPFPRKVSMKIKMN